MVKRKTSRTPWRRPAPTPVRKLVIPKPKPVRRPVRDLGRRPPPTPAEQVEQAIQVVAQPDVYAQGTPAEIFRARTESIAAGFQQYVMGPIGRAFGFEPRAIDPGAWLRGTGLPLGGGLGGMPMPTALPAPTRPTAAEMAAKYGGEPTELWFMQEDLGGRAGRAGEIWKAWAGGGRPLFVPKTAAEIIGVTEDQMREAGYERTLGGSWQATLPSRPDLQPPPSAGGSYGYTPSRYGYGGGGVRGQRGAGLINWRIGL